MPEAALAPVGAARRDAVLARLCGLALSTPATSFTQDELLPLLGLSADPFAETIFARSGVRKRHLELSPGTLATSLQARTEATEEQRRVRRELAGDTCGRDDGSSLDLGIGGSGHPAHLKCLHAHAAFALDTVDHCRHPLTLDPDVDGSSPDAHAADVHQLHPERPGVDGQPRIVRANAGDVLHDGVDDPGVCAVAGGSMDGRTPFEGIVVLVRSDPDRVGALEEHADRAVDKMRDVWPKMRGVCARGAGEGIDQMRVDERDDRTAERRLSTNAVARPKVRESLIVCRSRGDGKRRPERERIEQRFLEAGEMPRVRQVGAIGIEANRRARSHAPSAFRIDVAKEFPGGIPHVIADGM